VDGCGLLIGSPIQEIEKEAEGIAGMNLEGKIIAAALHLRCSRKRMEKRHTVEALAGEQYLSLQQEIESRTDFASPLHPNFLIKGACQLVQPISISENNLGRIESDCH
jgi:hypothetical protein